ncbi:KpsF/GutQ family sugar-phosphate isomerase [Bacillus sp. SD088]|uniref:KpsF/GutQ family sugar-phosphate isomerase n=1 Tax=Bacillus sp. SD088 TaxID=2782012 RepID=UPI001A95E5C8|nr:KpsF/GutQ family sugar-phosphate isomerase [Bacillus sp. SD088]MBO0991678.1 KpsF/GutQ family sugar-phosphate isomerase [Bacillus sp. SD088]
MSALYEIKKTIAIEALALRELSEKLDSNVDEAFRLIQNCGGKVVVTGVGKSGHIGKKVAATLASTGTPAFFVHSTEGVHGDLGMVERSDIVLMISNSGETEEVLSLLPSLEKMQVKKIAITKNKESTLSKACDVALTYQYEAEADHLGLAPTISTTLVLVMMDALAVSLCKNRNFKKEDFHLYHPGGSLGKQLSK